MISIIERIKFKFAAQPYHYRNRTGRSQHFVSYSIFTDQVKVRLSQFGFVEDHDRISRSLYLSRAAEIEADNKTLNDERIGSLHAEVERLKPYEVELRRIAEDLGEPNDPFAAWERIAGRRAPSVIGEQGRTAT